MSAILERERDVNDIDAEITRLSRLSAGELTDADAQHLRRIRDCRSSLLEVEEELAEVKERRKLRREALDTAILDASMYYDNRQLALNLR